MRSPLTVSMATLLVLAMVALSGCYVVESPDAHQDSGQPTKPDAPDDTDFGEDTPQQSQPIPPGDGPFVPLVDSTLALPEHLAGLDGGPDREVALVLCPDGTRDEFVVDEVIVHPADEHDLDDFLQAYNGVILRNGTVAGAPEEDMSVPSEPSGYYLVRVDLSASALDDFIQNVPQSGPHGEYLFSSEAAMRLAALVAREKDRGVTPNMVFQPQSIEHPDGNGGNIDTVSDTANFFYMSEDDDPATPGIQGLSIGVHHAWEYMFYQNVPPAAGTWTPPIVAVVDAGFALDEQSGEPLNNNLDYVYFGNNGPVQYDFADNDNRAGKDEQGWHGQGSFGVCCARPGNQFGSAGTGGYVVRPMLLRTSLGAYSIADSIRFAGIWGADVVSLSLDLDCGFFCGLVDVDDQMQNAVYTATALGAIVVAAASNDGEDISDVNLLPCKLDAVICVGGITSAGMNFYNYGDGVDIWAPFGVRTTPNPDTIGLSGINALPVFTGTSCATPFVAGIIGLMKGLDDSLRWDEALEILQTTANTSTDPKVTHGYVDAYRAVLATRENLPPAVSITQPSDQAEYSYASTVSMHADVVDPESPEVFGGDVKFYSDQQGLLCSAPCIFEDAPTLVPGTHVITALATDEHGAYTFSDAVTIHVVNQAPSAHITFPESGASYYADQLVNLRGYVFDFDLTIPETAFNWSSDLDGPVGVGGDIWVNLSSGEHIITLSGSDEMGAAAEAQIALTILPGEGVPSAQILAPEDASNVAPNTPLVLHGYGSDPEDGELTDDSLRWYSDIDGFLGTGQELEVTLSGPAQACNPDFVYHTITLEVTDSDGRTTTHHILLLVGVTC